MSKPITKRQRARLLRAAKNGIEFANPAAVNNMLARMNAGKKPDWTLTEVTLDPPWKGWRRRPRKGPFAGQTLGNDGGFEVRWATVSAGFGGFSFRLKDGKIYCDNEGCKRDFVKRVMCKLVDEAILDDDNG